MLSIDAIDKELSTVENMGDRLDAVITAHGAKRVQLMNKAAELEKQAAEIKKEANDVPDLASIRAELESIRKQALTDIKQAILAWCDGEEPRTNAVQLGAMQAVQTMYAQCKSFDQCINHLSGRGAYAVALIAAGVLQNPVESIVPPLEKLAPFQLYKLAGALSVADSAISKAKQSFELIEKADSQHTPTMAKVMPDHQNGRFVKNLSDDDFRLTFGSDWFERMRSFKESSAHPETAEQMAGIKSAQGYRQWQTANAVIMS